MTSATLTKWGNSNGVRIPAEVCNELGVSAGDVAVLEHDALKRRVTLTFQPREDGDARSYRRHRKMSLEEFAAGWAGGKTDTGEWGGGDVGAEVVG